MLAYYKKLERHDDTYTCPAHSILPIVKPIYKINRLSYNHYFLHVYSRYITEYDYIHDKTSHCSCSVVERVSTNFSDNPRTQANF